MMQAHDYPAHRAWVGLGRGPLDVTLDGVPRQFLVESVFVSAWAALSSLALVAAVLPAFGRWIGRSLDDRFDRLYRNDQRFGTNFALFAGLSVFIACLGMFGLAAFTAEQKAREISIRKVLGATAASIAGLLSRQFLRGVVAANVLAWPAAYLLMRIWTKDFHYRAPMSIGLFVMAGAAAAAFALLAVSVQTAKAARAHPAERLRRE